VPEEIPRAFGTAPPGAVRYACIDQRGCRAEFIGLDTPAPGDKLCYALTGLRERELAAAILAGQFDSLLGRP
jgi:hypothetical protein